MLEINNISCSVIDSDLNILNDFSLKIKEGETHVIMGPNGTGKSTLAKAIMGHYMYKITSGDILIDGESILDLEVDEISMVPFEKVTLDGEDKETFNKLVAEAIKKEGKK